MFGEVGGRARSLSGRAVVAAMLASLTLTSGALAAFPADPPNDPNYRPAEKGNTDQTYPPEAADPGGVIQTCGENAAENQQFHLFSFMPQCTKVPPDGVSLMLPDGATDPFNAPDPPAAGMSIDQAWKNYTAGNGDTVIAYIEAGINWRNGDAQELRKRVFLNAGELPARTSLDADADPQTLNVDDYDDQEGADDAAGNNNGVLDPEDLIVRFSDGVDDDSNGYTDDISGWDFYGDQNDPATVDSEYGHANGQMKKAAAEADNGISGAGICPHCMLLPIKGGAEALDRTDDLAESWLYAGDMGADVIVSVTADLGYSTFMKRAIEELWKDGVVMVEASNDFNSIDHQGGMFHEHVLPANGMVADVHGLPNDGPGAAAKNTTSRTYSARSNITSWGAHNMFTGTTEGGSTSESTPTLGGVMALVMAYGKEKFPLDPLSASEAVQVVRDTISDIDTNPNPPNGWEGRPGFDIQYGYGRPNVHRAMQAIDAGDIPPEAWFSGPDWYSLHDPENVSTIPVMGHVAAPRSPTPAPTWKLEFGCGPEPTESGVGPADGQFETAATGTGAVDGSLSSIDIADVVDDCDPDDPMALSSTKELETNDKYTVTLRLQVTDSGGRVGEERRAIAVHHDDTQREGFPRRISPNLQAGESQPVLADLQGTGELAMIFGEADGGVHAIDANGNELPGFPVTTDPVEVEQAHPGINPGNEPIVPGVAVGDLDHTGRLSVVATSTTGRVYVWNSQGVRRGGWPRSLNTGVVDTPIPRPNRPFRRDPIQGATAAPVLHDMDGDDRLDIVQGGWDGRVHVFAPNGSELPGWPVKADLPMGFPVPSGHTVIEDHKVDGPPTIAELDGDPPPEMLVRSQFSFAPANCADDPSPGCSATGGPGSAQQGGYSNVLAYNHNGTLVGGYPVSSQALIFYYGSAQEFITEGINVPVAANVDGDPETEWSFSPGIFSPTYLHEPDGSRGSTYGPAPDPTVGQVLGGTASLATLQSYLAGNLPSDAPVSFTTSGAFGIVGPSPVLSFAEPGSGGATVAGSLVLPGSGIPINNYMRVHDAATGANYPGFPSETQGLDFLGAPAIADVDGDGQPEVLEGGDSSVLHAFEPGGAQADEFPKFQSGWIVFGPATGDIDSDGDTEVVATTREGYLNVWETDGIAPGNNEWWQYRHDERNTGLYGIDTRPPGIIRDASIPAGTLTLNFTSPGDEWYAGTAASYEIVQSTSPIDPDDFDTATPLAGEPAPAAAGTAQSFALPAGTQRYVAIRAVDEAGNVSPVRSFDRGTTGGGGSGGGSGSDGTTQAGATGACAQQLSGDTSANRLVGTSGGDRISALAGDDTVLSRGGDDCVKGGRGDDRLSGGPDDDLVRGNKGDDVLKGRKGRDRLFGGNGDDVLKAKGGGRDLVNCGTGTNDVAIVDPTDKTRLCETVRGLRRRR